MRKVWIKLVGRECSHPHTVVVTSVGVRRTVCESCGQVSFRMQPEDSIRRAGRERLKKAAGL
ncbi:MAG TPA: hypothetical protein VMM14_08615 [Acidimicrobiia bacterium]|nr:hypothetical protein [Acidimicrobiia bacterium]